MIWQIIKKQAIFLLRNPQQLLLLIGLPILLITILGISLSQFMDGEPIMFDVKVAFIEQETEEAQINRFVNEIESLSLPEEAKVAYKKGMAQFQPIRILKEDVFGDLALDGVIKLDEISPDQLNATIENDMYAATIFIPENFTFHLLQQVLLDEKDDVQPQMVLYKNEGQSLASSIVEEILIQFQEQLTLSTYAEKNDVSSAFLHVDVEVGEILSINERRPVLAKEYYTIGMAVMNVLFLAVTIGSYAYTEKQSQVFNRIILANVSRWIYFLAILISGTLFAFIHLLIMFAYSWIVFGVTFPNVGAFFLITLGVALAVGGLSVLLTALSFRSNSEMVINFFQSVIVAILAFLGGSFFPIGDFVKVIQVIGEWTPNGAGMSAYLSVLRGASMSEIMNHLVFLSLLSISMVIIAAISFPKRGQTT